MLLHLSLPPEMISRLSHASYRIMRVSTELYLQNKRKLSADFVEDFDVTRCFLCALGDYAAIRTGNIICLQMITLGKLTISLHGHLSLHIRVP